MDALRESARSASHLAYVTGLRDLTDEALTREFRILEHIPELREDLEAEVARREKGKAAAA